MKDKGDNDLEEIIEDLKKTKKQCFDIIKELKKDNLLLAKEVDRLNEYVQVMELESRDDR
jgi:hypothetical protein|tara:strand:- start:1863 stop:2042 length:180 start_codon:yes stop_codon:yes gene_type:complete